ncbi:hypothetical protein HPB49_008642 [Dermacentor silvarum]|uniref:Uncharacterized protein n=1 Tax=Dermacentor silvarum TaxID=543639 RepID=A0ACB8CDX8_DERSI|nr:hypothetical protein HPB49_008642 [Dermacentor silvarum]
MIWRTTRSPPNLLPVAGYRATTLQGRKGISGNVSSLSWPLSNRKSLMTTSRPASTQYSTDQWPGGRTSWRHRVTRLRRSCPEFLVRIGPPQPSEERRGRRHAPGRGPNGSASGTLFDVDPTFDGTTIFEGLESSVPVVAIARSGDVVTLRFAGGVVPEEVLLFRRRRAVRPRLPRPLQCGRCGLFGHATVTCSRDPRCLQCAGRHRTNSCTVDRRRCLRCGGPHAATEPRCPQWQLERRVAATLASSKPRITRKQVLELARSSGAAVIDSSKQRPAGQRATESRPLSSRRQPGLSYSASLTGGTQADSSISGGVGEPPVIDNNPVQPPGATAPVTSVLVLTALASALRSLLELAPADSPARHMCVAALAMHDALVQHG